MFCNPSSKAQSNQKIKQLEAMGFNPDSARIALEMANDDIQQATDYLLSNQEAMMSATIPSHATNNSHYNNSSSSSTRTVRPNHPSAVVRKAGKAAANRAKFSFTFGSNQIQTPSSSFSSASCITPTVQTFDNHNYKSHHKFNLPSKRQQNEAFGRNLDMGTSASKKAKTFSIKKKRKTIKRYLERKRCTALMKIVMLGM